jgi:signal peptidase I
MSTKRLPQHGDGTLNIPTDLVIRKSDMFHAVLRHGILLLATLLAAQTFVAIGWLRPIEVSGLSMTPSFEPGDRLLVNRWRQPARWDAVLIRSPIDSRRLLVKRVIGLPGESLTLREGEVWVDGQLKKRRNFKGAASVYYGAFGHPTWRLGPDNWLVVGDNQPASVDSRNWHAAAGIPSRLIVGVVAE